VIETIKANCPSLKNIIAIDGPHAEWTDFTAWRDAQSTTDPKLPHDGEDDVLQLYTSGTTGLRPKVCA